MGDKRQAVEFMSEVWENPAMKAATTTLHKPALERLAEIDWDFRDADTAFSAHSFHPYPARYIPQIPGAIIEELTSSGETVYDPFMGGGTTLLEANLRKRNALGNDVSELAVLIAQVKTTPIKPELLLSLPQVAEKATDSLLKEKIPARPNISKLDYWFKDFVIDELSVIIKEINELNNPALADFCRVALSSILVTVSNQDSDTRYARTENGIKKGDTLKKFAKRLNAMRNVMFREWKKINMGDSVVQISDTRDKLPFAEDSADLVVTSPPYPNAYDYHLYHKYRFFWLDMNLSFLRKNEIGAHADYSKKNGPSENDFRDDMEKCLMNISGVLRKGRYLAVVIGDSILKGRHIRNDLVIREASEKTPFSFEGWFERNLNLRRKSFNPVIGNIKKEKILIFSNLK